MSDRDAVYRRLLRRETHSPRSGPAAVVAGVLAILLIGALVLAVWSAVDPQFRRGLSEWWASAGEIVSPTVALVVAAVIAMLLGLLMVLGALLPGRLARHARITDRSVIVIDDGVLADAAADAVAYDNDLERSQVSTVVRPQRIDIRVTPTSGLSIDTERVAAAARSAVSGAGFVTATSVRVADRGVIA